MVWSLSLPSTCSPLQLPVLLLNPEGAHVLAWYCLSWLFLEGPETKIWVQIVYMGGHLGRRSQEAPVEEWESEVGKETMSKVHWYKGYSVGNWGSGPLGTPGSQCRTCLRGTRKLGYLTLAPSGYWRRAVPGVSPQCCQLALQNWSMLLGPKTPSSSHQGRAELVVGSHRCV